MHSERRGTGVAAALDRLLEALDRLARGAVYAGGLLIFGGALLVSVEVVGRKLLGFSINGADEYCGYAYALSMAWGYGYVMLRRGHIRVEIVRGRLRGRARAILDLVSMATFTALVALLVWRALGVFEETVALDAKANTPLSTPLWIPQIVWLAGLTFFLLCTALVTLRSALAFIAGDLAVIEALNRADSEETVAADVIGAPPLARAPVGSG